MNVWRCILNERMKVLKLLEEGKINAEEAARLLEAIGESESRKRRTVFWQSMESLSDMMSDIMGIIFSSAFKNHTATEKVEVSGKKKLLFKGISGNIEINGTDAYKFSIEKEGVAKIIEGEEYLLIKAISGDIKIGTPERIDVEIKGLSGDIRLDNIDGRIEILSVSGSIAGKGLKGSFKGEFVSGDIDLEYERIDKIEIMARSGDVALKLNPNAEAEVEIIAEHGSINCELPLKNVIQRPDYLKGVLNKPASRIFINNRHGDVELRLKC
ncbi:MAG: DUF4097 domain-containing protein [candidate division WOR-3 bacterium]|nr:DUF4097 domain-containing protein [candidate division WOR-3 bacterium]